MMRLIKGVWLFIALVGLSACSTLGGNQAGTNSGHDVVVEDHSIESHAMNEGNATETMGESVTETKVIAGEDKIQGEDVLDDPNSPLSTRVVYFDYDSSTVRQEDIPVLEAHAAYLATHPNVTVRLTGHTDERGSREYNLALGERRAKAVRQMLMLQGASINQFEITSFGEERPVAEGHDEQAWQQNRRVEIQYIGHAQ